jgi:hypothetical protein
VMLEGKFVKDWKHQNSECCQQGPANEQAHLLKEAETPLVVESRLSLTLMANEGGVPPCKTGLIVDPCRQDREIAHRSLLCRY